ncbi:MAG TPA: mechanosensitive ion channel family protein [Acidobacteriota bacterium]|jgi:small-conductance mechanosensitive channel
MSVSRNLEVERLSEQEDVKRALEQTAGAGKPEIPSAPPKEKIWLGTYGLLLVVFAAVHYLLRLKLVPLPARLSPVLIRITLGVMAMIVVLAASKIVDVYSIGYISSAVSRYNLRRIRRLFTGLVIALILLSIAFVNWYTAFVSLGLISLILGFALQTPITSFIAWIYILVREPYRVGDRIKVGEASGDVIDVSYLDTTLWEFGGQYLSTDHPSGRIIKFPNSRILNSPVYNYSWPLFPYIWNEIKFQVGYDSDLEFVATTMQRVAEEDLGTAMLERIKVFRDLLAKTPVDELTVQERPVVMFRVGDNTWLEAIVRYVVPPREAGRVKTRLIRKMLAELNTQPERVRFPKGDAR